MPERTHLSIGEVLSLLREEFPDVTISKIRFQESQGLVDPERTPSGYRKFYDHDVERLRWILRQQREKFLPLKVIKTKLSEQPDRDTLSTAVPDRHDDGLDLGSAPEPARAELPDPQLPDAQLPDTQLGDTQSPDTQSPGAPVPGADLAPAQSPAGQSPAAQSTARPGRQAPAVAEQGPTGAAAPGGADRPRRSATPSLFAGIRRELDEAREPAAGPPARQPGAHGRRADVEAAESYTVEELARASGAELSLVDELCQFGLIAPETVVAGAKYFDESALAVARAAKRFAGHGVEVRHMRVWRNAADREADLFQQIVLPLLRQRNPQARREALDTLEDLTTAGAAMREALLGRALREVK
jgi:DNA-binding transcriptional MerR regulator